MNERNAIDTNLVVQTQDAASPEKQRLSSSLLEDAWTSGFRIVSAQVVPEYFAAATRKLGVPAQVAGRKVELLGNLEVISTQHPDVVNAIDLHRLHECFIWDASIITAAQKAQCRVL